MSEKKGYILPYGTAKQLSRLLKVSGPEAAVGLMEALEQYTMDGTEPEDLDPVAEIIFEGMRKELDIDREKYDRMIERNRKNAPKGNQTEPVDPSGPQRNPVESSGNQTKPVESSGDRQKTVDSRQKTEIIDSVIGAEPLIGLPLNDGSEHEVTEEDVAEYAQLYPAVDVMQQLRNMRGWLMANPQRRKTKRGIKAFIASWLAKEQDHPRARSGTHKLTAEEILAIPAINPWSEEVST